MKIWILKANEIKPVLGNNSKLGRVGLINEELEKRGHEVIWFTSTFSHLKKEQIYEKDTTVNIKPNYIIEFIKTFSYKRNISIRRIISYQYMAHKFWKKALKMKKPDIIYVAFPTIELAEKAIKYGKKNNIPIVVDVRDLWPDIFNHNLSGIVKILAQPYIYLMNVKTKKIMKQADNITATSPMMLEWAQKKGDRLGNRNDQHFHIGYKKQAEGIKSAIDIERKIKVDSNCFNVCFMGTLVKQFNFDILIDVAKRLEKENVKFYICGHGIRAEELKEKTKDIKNIVMTGWLEKEELNYALENMNIGFAPYNNTFDFQVNIPNKFAEYLFYGLPIIITSDGSMAEIVENNNIGIASRDIEKISEFILKLKNDKEEYKKMSNRATQVYKDGFMADKVYSDLSDYLEKIVENYKK